MVGLFVFPSTIVEDDVDVGSSPNNLFTPALTRQLLRCCVNYAESGVQVEGGLRNVARVESEIAHVLPAGFPAFITTQSQTSKAQRAIKPEAIALGVFGGIVALAALLIAAQLIGRELRLGAGEREVMRALGAGPGRPRPTGSSASSSRSWSARSSRPRWRSGSHRSRPSDRSGPSTRSRRELRLDRPRLRLPRPRRRARCDRGGHRLPARPAPRAPTSARSADRPSRVCTAAAKAGMGLPATTGVRFALSRAPSTGAVPVRSAILGAAMAMVALVATVTFGASLDSLVSHPALYGWNWDYMLVDRRGHPPGEGDDTARPRPLHRPVVGGLHRVVDHRRPGRAGPRRGARCRGGPPSCPVTAWTRARWSSAPSHSQLHEYVGDTVDVSTGVSANVHLRVVGTAAMPTIGAPVASARDGHRCGRR